MNQINSQSQADCLLKGDFKPEDFLIKDSPIENIAKEEPLKKYFENPYFILGQLIISGHDYSYLDKGQDNCE